MIIFLTLKIIILTSPNELFHMSFRVFCGGAKTTSLLKFRVLTSLLMSPVAIFINFI